MMPPEFTEAVEEQIERCRDTLLSKGEEYAPTDRFANFKKAAGMQGLSTVQALGGMLAKHTISINDMIWDDKIHSKAQWQEKIGDHINYLLILAAMLEDGTCPIDADPDALDGVSVKQSLESIFRARDLGKEKDRAEELFGPIGSEL